MSPAKRLAVVGVASVTLVLLMASPAFAHAVLLQTTPGQGAVLAKAPKQVTLRYDEQVTFLPGAIRVYNTSGARVDTGTITNPATDTVAVGVKANLADGAYIVTWRVISADTHPVQGAFTFQIGTSANATAPNVTSEAQKLLNKQGGNQTLGVIYGFVRGALYAGIALFVGAVFFAGFLWSGLRGTRRLSHLVWTGWVLTVVATIATVVVQGAYAAGLGVGDMFRWNLIHPVLDAQLGHLSIVRIAVLLGAIPLLRMLLRDPSEPLPTWWRPTVVLGAVVLALTPALTGHAHTGDLTTFGVPADVIHVLAMSIWLGGLVVLAYAVFPGRDVTQLRDAVPRFSRVASWCVVALVATGSFQAWRQVGSIHALRTTTYGQTLLVKLAIVGVLVLVGAFSRQVAGYLFGADDEHDVADERVPVVAGGADDAGTVELGHDDVEYDEESDEAFQYYLLRRAVIGEVLLGIAVVVVTALLVNAAPAKLAADQPAGGATGVTLKTNKIWVDVTVSPDAAPGPNDIHFTAIKPDGAPTNLINLTATLDFPSRHIATLQIPLRHLGPGHYLSPGFTIPFKGGWRITVHAQLDRFNEVTLAGTLTIA